jgi:hypothetical protein
MDLHHKPVLAARHRALSVPIQRDELIRNPKHGAVELDLRHLRLDTESDEAAQN